MKAIITESYGGPEVLKLREIETPQPKENEVLIKIQATSVTMASTFMRAGKPYFGRLFLGLTKPKTPIYGSNMAGVISKVGSAVTKFKVGDEVIAETGINRGCYAEYICLSEDELIVPRPQNLSPIEATGMLDGGSTALSFFTDTIQIKKGQKILINGASGSIGTAAVQLAKYFGAEVTGVCSARNINIVNSLGADYVIDYTKEDFTKNQKQYDIIFDTVGKLSFGKCKKVLSNKGTFLTPVLTGGVLFKVLGNMIFGKKKLKFAATGIRKPELRMRDLKKLKELAENGQIRTIIDRTYRLEEIQDAHEYVGTGHKRGNVVISMLERNN